MTSNSENTTESPSPTLDAPGLAAEDCAQTKMAAYAIKEQEQVSLWYKLLNLFKKTAK